MSDNMPERIAAWRFTPQKADEWVYGGWSEDHDRKTTAYVRADYIERLEADRANALREAASRACEWANGEARPIGIGIYDYVLKGGGE